MPFLIGTEITNLPSQMDGRFVTAQATLAPTGGETFTDSTLNIGTGSTSRFWIEKGGGDGEAINQAAVEAIFEIGDVIVQAPTEEAAATAAQYTITGFSDSSSFVGVLVTPAISPATTTNNNIYFATTGEAIQPTLADEREIVYLETPSNTEGDIEIVDAQVSILGSFPDSPADAIVQYGNKGAFTTAGSEPLINMDNDNTSTLHIRNRTIRTSGGVRLWRAGTITFEGTVAFHNTNTNLIPYLRTSGTGTGNNNIGVGSTSQDIVLDGDVLAYGLYWDGCTY